MDTDSHQSISGFIATQLLAGLGTPGAWYASNAP